MRGEMIVVHGGRVSAIWSLLCLCAACSGDIQDPSVPGGPCSAEQAELQRDVGHWLQTTCSHAGCHGPVGARSPSFAVGDLSQWSHDQATLMERLDPHDSSQLMPPTVNENPPDVIAMVERWYELGARANCPNVEAPQAPRTSSNAYDSDELFTCRVSTPFEPSVALTSRAEFVHRSGGFFGDAPLEASPFPDISLPYSTATSDLAIDATVLGLHLDTLWLSRDFRSLDRGFNSQRDRWFVTRGGSGPLSANQLWIQGLEESARNELSCITDDSIGGADVAADAPCVTRYVEGLLSKHALQRSPTESEVDRLVAFLREELLSERERSDRARSLQHVIEASLVLFGSMHREATGGRGGGTLSSDEWSLALTRALSTGATHGGMIDGAARPELAWFSDFLARDGEGGFEELSAVQGFIGEVLSLENGYVGGEFARGLPRARPDLVYDGFVAHKHRAPRRGRHWLAPRVADFFREYFDYGDVEDGAKDDPIATSRYEVTRPYFASAGAFNQGYDQTRRGASGDARPNDEPPMRDQLDDFIARVVVEAERDGRNVLAALLQDRTYRVPASIAFATGFPTYNVHPFTTCDPTQCIPCRTEAGQSSACTPTHVDREGNLLGQDLYVSFRGNHLLSAVYNVAPIREPTEIVEADDATLTSHPSNDARWVEMPEDERAGVLTHPTWLASHGAPDETGASAVLRGHWIREHLFCQDVGGLDLVQLQAQLAPAAEGPERARDRLVNTFGDLSDLNNQTGCGNQACHGRMNNLGLAFETYNHAGFTRHDDHGSAPDGSATIHHWPGRSSPVAVEDAVELSQLLSEDPYVRRCFLRHVFRFFAGRGETPADACVLQEMETAFATGSFFAAVEALMKHESFLRRQSRRPS